MDYWWRKAAWCLMESLRRYLDNSVYSISGFLLFQLFGLPPYTHENRVFVWMMLLLFFPPTRNQFCSCEVAVVTVEMFVISEKICVRMCKLLCRWFLLCVLKGVRTLQNGRFWFQPLLTTSFNHLGWNFPGFVCLTLSFSGKLLQKLFTYFLK